MAARDVIVLDSDTKKPVSLLTMKPSQAKHSSSATESFNGSHAKVFNVDKIPLVMSPAVQQDRVQLVQPAAILQPSAMFGKPMVSDNSGLKPMIRNDAARTASSTAHSHTHAHSHGSSKEDHHHHHHLAKSHHHHHHHHHHQQQQHHSQAVSDIAVKPSKELVQRHLSARKILRRQLDRKLTNVPYPKTYRQVWPVIPVGDNVFLSTVGLEAACGALDPSFKSREPKRRPSNAPKPVCQQCGSDFAPAWQVRKKTESTYLLCEMCDFANLKNVHRDKIGAQLKECSAMIDKEFTEIDRKFQSDLQGQVAHSVSSLFQNHNSSPLSLHSSSAHKHTPPQQPTAIAQSVIQSSSTAMATTASLGVPSAAQLQSMMVDSTQKSGTTSSPSPSFGTVNSSSSAAAGGVVGREAESVNRLSALERSLQQRSSGVAALDAKRKRGSGGAGRVEQESGKRGRPAVAGGPSPSSSRPSSNSAPQGGGGGGVVGGRTPGPGSRQQAAGMVAGHPSQRAGKPRGSPGVKTLDSMLQLMKCKATAAAAGPHSLPSRQQQQQRMEVLGVSDGNRGASVRGDHHHHHHHLEQQQEEQPLPQSHRKERSRKLAAPKHVKRPAPAEVLPSSSPNSCIVVIDQSTEYNEA